MAEKRQKDGVVDKFVEALTSILKNVFGLEGFDLNKILSLGNPEIKSWASTLAEKAKEYVHEDNIIRSKMAERAFGWVTAAVEEAAEGKSAEVKAILKKLADFLETFVDNFCKPDDGDAKHGSKHLNPELARKLAEVKATTFARYHARIEKATETELPALLVRIQQEVEISAKIEQVLVEGVPKPPASPKPLAPPRTPITERLKKAGDALDDSQILEPVAQALRDVVGWLQKT